MTLRIPVFDAVAEKSKLFTPQYLSMIDTANVEMERDGIDYGMIYYKNAAVKVFAKHHEIYEYSELKGYVWNNQIIDRVKAQFESLGIKKIEVAEWGEEGKEYRGWVCPTPKSGHPAKWMRIGSDGHWVFQK